GVERALAFEITRQKNLVRRGLVVTQETRHFDEVRGITISMRTKEFEHDYRYFPEPDLVPLHISGLVEELKREIPELPDEKRTRFATQYSITQEHATALTYDISIADYYEEVASKIDSKLSAVWIADVLKGELNYRSISMREASERISTDEFVSILRYLNKSVITERGATEIVREMLDHGGTPDEIIKDKGLASIGSEDIEKAVSEVIEAHKSAVEDYKAGKTEALNFIVGQVMKKTRGRAEPKEVREFVRARIDHSADGQS
ncbi:MAG: hypothetical protein KAT65_12840, partial [Methanophagales archaeon]|nr:hypothetical protein [Methanophagales archaeon]